MFRKIIILALLGFLFPNLAISQGLLNKLSLDEENINLQLYKLIKPILLYDPKVVKVTVLKDLKVFKGLYHGFKKPRRSDDKQIYKFLNAKSGEILLKVNVQVNLDRNYVSKIKSKLKKLADLSEPMDGSSCKRCVNRNSNSVKFYIGAIKGNNRTQVYVKQKDGTENIQESHYALGVSNTNVRPPDMGGNGLWVNKPFTFYGFDKSKENGKLCINIIKNIISDIQPPSVVDNVSKKLKPAHDNYWSIVYPHIVIKFVDGGGKIVNKDELIFDARLRRTASVGGYGTAKVGETDTYQSIVSLDRNNGWHEQDHFTRGLGPKGHFKRFSEITNSLKFAFRTRGNINCRFGIAEQTNFSIITKVNKKILGSTQKIIVDMHYMTFDHASTEPSLATFRKRHSERKATFGKKPRQDLKRKRGGRKSCRTRECMMKRQQDLKRKRGGGKSCRTRECMMKRRGL